MLPSLLLSKEILIKNTNVLPKQWGSFFRHQESTPVPDSRTLTVIGFDGLPSLLALRIPQEKTTYKILFCCLGLATGIWLWQRVAQPATNFHVSTSSCTLQNIILYFHIPFFLFNYNLWLLYDLRVSSFLAREKVVILY